MVAVAVAAAGVETSAVAWPGTSAVAWTVASAVLVEVGLVVGVAAERASYLCKIKDVNSEI